jgi:diguanylate cyclase (GGDEF)-like protein/PAS domain S-box-containing protein
VSFALEQTGSDWERRFRLLAGNTRALVSLHDADGTFRFASDAVSELTGMPAESLEGSPALGVIHPGDGHRVLEAMSAWLSGVGPRGASYRMLAASGGWVEVESSFSAAGGPEVLWTTRRLDIVGSGPGRAPETDAATGLPTRQALLERLEWALHPAGEGEVAVLVIRIEGLLAIVAEHGRAAADLIVRELGRHVDAVLRPADMVGRLGAGELGAVCHGVSTPLTVIRIGERTREAVARPLGGGALRISAGIGTALAAEDGGDPDHLLRVASERA